jgi:2-polyprenyl-6-methoxyphenol hydroxylase-like FAD-dependent oxidoreductase
MPRIGIVGAGIGGLQLALFLQKHGIAATVYAEKTPAQHLASQLRNVVCRNGCTRERERALGVNHWDETAPDLCELAVSVGGAPIAFAGRLTPPSHVVDMRIYWARLLEDFSSRGGQVVFGMRSPSDVEALSAQHDLLVVASGRGSLANLFPRMTEHSPYSEPQRVVVAGLFRGIGYREPRALEVFAARGHGEILAFPLFSFEPGLTGLGIEAARGGAFRVLTHVKYETDRLGFERTVLELLREHAPALYSRVDRERFGVARPLDVGYAAITPTVRRAHTRLSNGRLAFALADAHIVMDPITGQGANKASHAAWVLGTAIRDTRELDEEFCRVVERQICTYALPVSDAANARLQPPQPHVARLLAAASECQAIADLYAEGFNHPDRYWQIVSNEQRTESVRRLLTESTLSGAPQAWENGRLLARLAEVEA